jgi:tetratricopeptide (TPR) repeat protein
MVRQYADRDYEGAEAHYLRALELDPGYVHGRQQYGLLLADTGRLAEAEAFLRKAHDLDPLSFDPGTRDLGRVLELRGKPEQAVAFWSEKILFAPGYAQPHLHLGDYLCRSGRSGEGMRSLEQARRLNPEGLSNEAAIGHCLAISGRPDEARAVLRDLEQRSHQTFIDPSLLALILVPLGEHDRALDELERAFDLHSVRLPRLFRDPRFAALRGNPRFEAVRRRVGLPSGDPSDA